MEKRQLVRTVVHVPVTVEFYDPIEDDFYYQSGIIVDTSSKGIRIKTSKLLEQGQPVLIRSNLTANRFINDSSADRVCHGEIKWSQGKYNILENAVCHAGICFYEPSKRIWC